MNLESGRRLGPYEIISLAGAGGMGEVYRARDTRLDRLVAIKVLPAHLTANPDVRARFEREARAISALSHPNICALYDVGREGDTEYLVMEYLEGETLADKIARGPLPPSQVLRTGTQIAEALQQAHRAGITHRDLKPGNIMITGAGAKLLDFGLAKLVDPSPGDISDQSATAMRLDPLTAAGSIVGTYQYMAPEQLEGKAVDHRADIFSLGVVLYEMATGRRPFEGSSPASVIASILSTDPVPIRSLQAAAPAELDRIVLTALQKNPEERWQTAQDVALQLRWIGEASQPAQASARVTPLHRRHTTLAAGLIAALASVLVTWGVMRWLPRSRADAVKAHLHIWLPPDIHPARFYEWNNFALSPDGKTLCFAATRDGNQSLILRSLDSYSLTRIEGTEGAAGPFWSSDGAWIGFSARGKLWKVRAAGGPAPEAICDVATIGAVGYWRDRTILFADAAGGRPEIFRVSDSGGEPVAVTHVKPGQWRHSRPFLLPDGEHFLYLAYAPESIERQLLFASLKTSKETVVMRNASKALLLGDQLIYVRDGKLLTQPFDAATGALSGDPRLIASDVSYFYPAAQADFDVANSTVVYRTDTRVGRLSVMNRSGVEMKVIDDRNVFYDFGLSRDGGKAAVSVVSRATGLADIWIYDLARGIRERFASEPWHEVTPVWSPDGRFIVYSEAAGGTFPHIVRRAVSDPNAKTVDVSPRGPFQFAGSFTPDGQTVFMTREDERTQADIYRLELRTGSITPVLSSTASETGPAVSPDGKWLAFASDATGENEVYVMNLTGPEPLRIRVSTKGGDAPSWRSDGAELFYMTKDGRIVSVRPGPSGKWDDASLTELFHVPAAHLYRPLPDGQSFVVMQGSPGPADSLFHVLLGVQ